VSSGATAVLPSGWAWASFDDAFEVISDRGRRVPQHAYEVTGALPVVDQGEGLFGGFTNDVSMAYDGPRPVIVFGDHTRRVKLLDRPFAVGAQGVKLLAPRACFDPKFLYYLLPTLDLADRGYSRHFQYLRKLALPAPPLAVQRRIVAAIEEHLSELDAAVAGLRRVQAQLPQYGAAVLKAGCEGRSPTGEVGRSTSSAAGSDAADQVLASVLAARQRCIQANGNRRRQPESPVPDVTHLPRLPLGWTWVTLGQVVWSVKDGPHFSPKYVEQGVPFITGGHVRPTGVDFSRAKYITPELHAELSCRCKPEVGDILYTKGGTTGIARVNTYDFDFSVWVHVAVLKLVAGVDPFYIQHALNSPWCRQQAQRFTHGVGNQDLGLTRMVKITLPLPPLPEQRRIVTEIDRRLSYLDELEKQVSSALSRAAHLRRSVLRSAFAGTLVQQDPTDEPPEQLLARIRAERAQAPARSRRRSTSRR
jgi:type I restriction enzyme, S subunit